MDHFAPLRKAREGSTLCEGGRQIYDVGVAFAQAPEAPSVGLGQPPAASAPIPANQRAATTKKQDAALGALFGSESSDDELFGSPQPEPQITGNDLDSDDSDDAI